MVRSQRSALSSDFFPRGRNDAPPPPLPLALCSHLSSQPSFPKNQSIGIGRKQRVAFWDGRRDVGRPPDDCWEFIFRRLGPHRRLSPISLACKRFLTITGLVRASLTRPTLPSPSHSRFPVFTSLALCRFHPNLDRFFCDLAHSALPLQTLRLSFQDRFPRTATRILGLRMQKTLNLLLLHVPVPTSTSLFSPTASPTSIG